MHFLILITLLFSTRYNFSMFLIILASFDYLTVGCSCVLDYFQPCEPMRLRKPLRRQKCRSSEVIVLWQQWPYFVHFVVHTGPQSPDIFIYFSLRFHIIWNVICESSSDFFMIFVRFLYLRSYLFYYFNVFVVQLKYLPS